MKLRHLLALAGALALSLPGGCAAREAIDLDDFEAAVAVDFQDRSVLVERMRDVPLWRDDRVNRVVEMFREAGCRELLRGRILGSSTPNVMCRLRGRSPRTIVVASHHVVPPGGKGVIDDWSGTVLLPTLYSSLASRPREHTYLFVAYATAAYDGDASYMHLRDLSENERSNIAAMLWLDMLGMGEMSAWGRRTDPNLWTDLYSVAQAIDVKVNSRDLNGAATIHDGSRAYRWFGIPTIYLHSVSLDNQALLRDPIWDNDPNKLDYDAYFDSYRVLAVYLAYLDKSLAARGM